MVTGKPQDGHSCEKYLSLVYLGFWWNKYASWIANLDAAEMPLPHNWGISLNQRHQSLKGLSTYFSWCWWSCWCVRSLSLPWRSSGSSKGWLQGFSWFCNGHYLILPPCWSVSTHLWQWCFGCVVELQNSAFIRCGYWNLRKVQREAAQVHGKQLVRMAA